MIEMTANESFADADKAAVKLQCIARGRQERKKHAGRKADLRQAQGAANMRQKLISDGVYYNVSFIFEILHKKSQGEKGNSMHERINKELGRGKKSPIPIPDTIVYKRG